MSKVENSVDKYRISIARGHFIKDYLWRKIEVGTLISPQSLGSQLLLVLPVNIKTSSFYPSPSFHVTLCFVSALRCKNSVVSSGIGGVQGLAICESEKLSPSRSAWICINQVWPVFVVCSMVHVSMSIKFPYFILIDGP